MTFLKFIFLTLQPLRRIALTLTATALLGYIAWTLFLIVLIEMGRVVVTVKTGKAANSFLSDGSDISPLATRLSGAHSNCVENFPLVGGTLLLALVTEQHDITDPLALWLLLARFGQSCMHLVSGTSRAAQIRFAFFIMQLGMHQELI